MKSFLTLQMENKLNEWKVIELEGPFDFGEQVRGMGSLMSFDGSNRRRTTCVAWVRLHTWKDFTKSA